MLNFFICGIVFWLYAYLKFKKGKIFYPSIIFSFMWGTVCIYTATILNGYGQNLNLKDYYVFYYMDIYIIYFTIAVMLGFFFAHFIKRRNSNVVNLIMDFNFISRVLSQYKWSMWLNFWGGILRISIMVNTVGLDNMMDYRLAANSMMMTSSFTFAGLVFKFTAYVQMLANFYLGLYGLKLGFDRLDFKKTLGIFILYAPTQMATGGRLFIFYFILFFFGAFLLGRGLAMRKQYRNLLEPIEKSVLIFMFAGLLGLVALIAMFRSGDVHRNKETAVEKFAYITEGMLATEYLIRYYPQNISFSYGENTLKSTYSQQYLAFRKHLNNTRMSSIVTCIFTPLYLDFGYWGSIFILFFIAFLFEFISLNCLSRMNLINFCIYMVILKIFYESVMAQSISSNIPNYELIILFAIFYKVLFGRMQLNC